MKGIIPNSRKDHATTLRRNMTSDINQDVLLEKSRACYNIPENGSSAQWRACNLSHDMCHFPVQAHCGREVEKQPKGIFTPFVVNLQICG